MNHVAVVATQNGALADAVARDPRAPVAKYPNWSTADLGRHVGTIHRWATTLVETRATERLPKPDLPPVADDDVAQWLVEGCDRLVTVLAATAPTEPMWTFASGHDTAAFWRRRMAAETTLHRWDAQDAVGQPDPVPDDFAVEAVAEALEIYLHPHFPGVASDDGGHHVHLVAGDTTWALRMDAAGLVADTTASAPDVALHAGPSDMWLFLVGRVPLEDLRVVGDGEVATLFADEIASQSGPG